MPEFRGSVNQDLHSGLVIELAAVYDAVCGPEDHDNGLGRPTGGGGGSSAGAPQDTVRSDAALLTLRTFARAMIAAGANIRAEDSPMSHIWADYGAIVVHPLHRDSTGVSSLPSRISMLLASHGRR